MIDGYHISDAIAFKFHEMLSTSPGGGLWYIYSLFWIMLMLYIFYMKKNDLYILLAIFGLFYFIRGIWKLSIFDSTILELIRHLYDFVFISELTFFFHMEFFLVGMLLARISIKNIRPIFLVITQVVFYFIYIVTEHKQELLAGTILFQFFRMLVSLNYFLIAVNVPWSIFRNNDLIKNARGVSTIIYFTHFFAIYCMRFLFRIAGVNYYSYLTPVYIIVLIALFIYSWLLIKLDKNGQVVNFLYGFLPIK